MEKRVLDPNGVVIHKFDALEASSKD